MVLMACICESQVIDLIGPRAGVKVAFEERCLFSLTS